jgi:hypothetical protein
VEGGGGGLTVSGVSRNRGDFVKCVAIQKKVRNPWATSFHCLFYCCAWYEMIRPSTLLASCGEVCILASDYCYCYGSKDDIGATK